MIHHFSDAKVLVVGDIMLDRYYSGSTERISPEAPVPVVHVKSIQNRAGGAGNVALNIASLGGQASLAALVGQDEAAEELTQSLHAKGVQTHFITTSLPTITKLRVLSQQQQLLRMDFEEGFSHVDKTPLVQAVAQDIQQSNVMILSDYGKGTLSDTQALIKQAKAQGSTILVDPKGTDFSRYNGASLITPNMKEFEAVVGKCHDDAEIIAKAEALMAAHSLEGVLITRSEKGMTLVRRGYEAVTIPALAKEVYDVTGAGDTVIAVMGMSISAGYEWQEAMQLANAAASVVVGKVGTATVSLDELNHAMHKMTHIADGVLSQSEILFAMNQAHLQGEKVVMTNGCFDILHAGHVEYLKKSRALGDRLIVAVNTDESVQRLKGPTRPIVPLHARMDVLAALECVDWVVAFDEDTPERIISELLPDILVKGADYTVDQIAGAKQVIANGGEVKTIDLKPNFSTSNIVEKIKKPFDMIG